MYIRADHRTAMGNKCDDIAIKRITLASPEKTNGPKYTIVYRERREIRPLLKIQMGDPMGSLPRIHLADQIASSIDIDSESVRRHPGPLARLPSNVARSS